VSLQFGWSFSRRFAVLLDFDVGGGWDNSFNHLIGGPHLRYAPSSRIWIEAGYALYRITMLPSLVAASLARDRLTALLLSGFAGLAVCCSRT
jgi:hypothetical protein